MTISKPCNRKTKIHSYNSKQWQPDFSRLTQRPTGSPACFSTGLVRPTNLARSRLAIQQAGRSGEFGPCAPPRRREAPRREFRRPRRQSTATSSAACCRFPTSPATLSRWLPRLGRLYSSQRGGARPVGGRRTPPLPEMDRRDPSRWICRDLTDGCRWWRIERRRSKAGKTPDRSLDGDSTAFCFSLSPSPYFSSSF